MGFTLGSSSCYSPPLLRPNALVTWGCCPGFTIWAHRRPQEEPGMPPPSPVVRGNGNCSSRRRAAAAALLLIGASVSSTPPLFPVAGALQVDQDSVMSQEPGSVFIDGTTRAESTPLEQTDSEHLHRAGTPATSFLSVLNSIGVLASGVLGALYAISRQDKAAVESDIQTMKSILGEKETAISSMKKAFEEKMLSEKQDRQKTIRVLKEGESALSNQLASANATISGLGHELRNHRRSVTELQQKVEELQACLSQADEEKRRIEGQLKDKTNEIDFLQDRVGLLGLEVKDKEKSIEGLQLSLAGTESECDRLSTLLDLTKGEHENACSSVEQLKQEVTKTQEELDSRNRLVGELEGRLNTIIVERDEASQKLLRLQDDYNRLKSDSFSREKSFTEILSKKDDEIRQLDEKLAVSKNEAETSQAVIVKLGKERDTIRIMLEQETDKVNKLQSELQHEYESLRAAKLDASNWSTQLEESEIRCQELQLTVAKIQLESSNAEKLLKSNLEEARSTSSKLSNEIAFVKDALSRTEEEFHRTSDELRAAVGEQESLKRELVEVYKKVDSTAEDLKEERKKAVALSQELEASINQIKRDSKTVVALQNGLNEATKSLSDMNQRASTLARELESAGSTIKSLEEEKEFLYSTLLEQNNLTLEAQQNIEDAQNLIMRLGSERENLDRRASKLEEDLAAAKGQILRMRRERSPSDLPSNRNQSIDEKEDMTVVKRNGNRRKKTEQPSEGAP